MGGGRKNQKEVKAMKHWRLKRLTAGEKPGTGEWEVSPWWSSFLPLLYKSKSYYFPLQRHELPITPYREKNGKMVVSPSMEAEYWNGWLVALWQAIGSLVDRATAKLKAIIHKPDPEDIPF